MTLKQVVSPNTLTIYRCVGDSSQSAAGGFYAMPDAVLSVIAWSIKVPVSWNTTQNPTVTFFGYPLTTAAGNYRFEWGLTYFKDGEVIVGVDQQTITFTQAASVVAATMIFPTPQAIDGTLIELSDIMFVTFRRLGADGLDTRTGDFIFLGILVAFPRLNFAIAT